MIPSPRRSTVATMTAVIITTSFLKGAACSPPGHAASLGFCSHQEGAPPRVPGGFIRGRWPLPPLICRRSALHPGYFLPDEKVTKESPRAAPFGIPRCVVAALAALAYASRRATFSHRKRPICHFEFVGKSVFFLPELHRGSHPLLLIRGAAGLASRMLEGFIYRNQYR